MSAEDAKLDPRKSETNIVETAPSPRLEELLLADPLDELAVVTGLLEEHYTSIYRLAYALLEDPHQAHQATITTAGLALANVSRFRKQPDLCVWLYSLALKAIARLEGALAVQAPPQTTATEDQGLWDTIDSFHGRERLLLLLYYALDCHVSQAATVLHVSQGAVQAQIDIFRQRFSEAAGTDLTDEEQTAALETRIKSLLQERWPAPELSPEQLAAASHQALQEAHAETTLQRRRRSLHTVIGVGVAAILAAVCLAGGAYSLVNRARATATQISFASPQATAVPPALPGASLTRRSTPDEIQRRLIEGPELWRTLWIDVQMTDYGPLSYIGPAKTYRARAWISQPDESLELFGSLSGKPSNVYLVNSNESVTINSIQNLSKAEKWDGSAPNLLQNSHLRQMVFPEAALWGGEGTLHAVGSSEIAKRDVITVDWYNPLGKREAALWIDALNGMVLRQQVYAGQDYKVLAWEAIVTQIAFDQSSPPYDLSDYVKLEAAGSQPPEQLPAAQVLLPTPTPAIIPTRRPLLPQETAPPALDPAHSWLKFQFPKEADAAERVTHTSEAPVQLFADDYYLGDTQFGLPWALRCTRSPDGERIAFNTGSDGATKADERLHWFNLADPAEVYQPLLGIRAYYFAFSPDSRQLAVLGLGVNETPAILYVLEIATGEYERVIELQQASFLSWSQDGNHLALFGHETDEDDLALLVIHIQTRQVTWRLPIKEDAQTSASLAASEWGTQFPDLLVAPMNASMGGMDACAKPPLQ
jgi:DNA-directed RNA polymerase specialized sigma24 family protein